MTEADWPASTDVTAMLTFAEGRLGSRKLRLFAVACCWRIWPLLTDVRSRKAVKVATRFADGEASERERTDAYLDARAAADELGAADRDDPFAPDTAPVLQAAIAARNAVGVFRSASDLASVSRAVVRARGQVRRRRSLSRRLRPPVDWPAVVQAEWGAQAALLRDLTGPIRPVPFAPRWTPPWIVQLAGTLYDNRDFAALPMLADALEEAGCTCTAILDHCRRGGNHIRGCWVLDGLLEREQLFVRCEL
jgi:hypothetical protein